VALLLATIVVFVVIVVCCWVFPPPFLSVFYLHNSSTKKSLLLHTIVQGHAHPKRLWHNLTLNWQLHCGGKSGKILGKAAHLSSSSISAL